MSAQPLDCVVDASIGIKLFITEVNSDEAHALFAHLAVDPPARFFVPDLFYVECTNILWKYVKRSGLGAEEARFFVEQLGQLALTSTPTASLIVDALDIAMAYDLTVYDATYVTLAERLGLPLITADRHLAAKLIGTSQDVRLLSDYPNKPIGT